MDSPLHTILKYSTKRWRLLSSDEEDTGRSDEGITCSECVAKPTCTSLSSKNEAKKSSEPPQVDVQCNYPSTTEHPEYTQVDKRSSSDMDGRSGSPAQAPITQEVDGEVIIFMTHSEDAVWNSEIDSQSDTSIPGYKRGWHEDWDEVWLEPGLELEAIEQIKLDSKQIHSATKRPASVHILADAQMEFWPQNDNICIMDFRPGWSLKWWTASLRAESIRIQCHSVIQYFEMAQNMEVQPLKNALQALCRVIRQHSWGARIYVANLLPQVHASPVTRPLSETNFVILQVARGVNRALSKIHFLSTFEHFVSKWGNRIIKPTHKYFGETGELTGFGCLILRECFLREAGLKPYWFK